MKKLLILFLILLSASYALRASATASTEMPDDENSDQELSAEEAEYYAWATEFLNQLKSQTGTVELPNGVATLNLGENYYYLPAEEAEKVLVEAWGNAPDPSHLGMIFPAQFTPLDQDAWGVLIEYSEEGYIDDENANDINYDDLLESMQEDTREANEYRVEQGYDKIQLLGWAAPPYYDAVQHKLHWAKELQFGNSENHTLNYNLRVLGRKGVLSLNFIANMSQLPEIEQSLGNIMAVAEFNPGYRYDEFDPEYDKVAAYGIGALVAGKVLAKTGLLAMGLIFLKKFWFIIAAAFYGVGKILRKKNA